MQGSITYPGANGGSNWGGPSIDHSRKIMIANSMNIASTLTMIPREDCDKAIDELARDKVQSKASVVEPNLGTPYCTLRAYGLLSPLGVPCTKPPWGKLTAIVSNKLDNGFLEEGFIGGIDTNLIPDNWKVSKIDTSYKQLFLTYEGQEIQIDLFNNKRP